LEWLDAYSVTSPALVQKAGDGFARCLKIAKKTLVGIKMSHFTHMKNGRI